MRGYTAQIKEEVGLIASKIEKGSASKVVLTLVVAGTIFREGSEIMLFIYSFVAAQDISAEQCIVSLAIGSLGGLSVGLALYLGLLKFAGRYIFKICFWLLVFIAAGLASQAAGIMTSIGMITSGSGPVWDSSWLVSDTSLSGELLKILIGYEAKPNTMQILFYFATLSILCICSHVQTLCFNRQKIKLKEAQD